MVGLRDEGSHLAGQHLALVLYLAVLSLQPSAGAQVLPRFCVLQGSLQMFHRLPDILGQVIGGCFHLSAAARQATLPGL